MPKGLLIPRGKQDPSGLWLTFDRKVAPRGWLQQRIPRWVPRVASSFGLLAGATCPGKTPFCDSCYGTKSEQGQGVSELLRHNTLLLRNASEEHMYELLSDMMRKYRHDAQLWRLAPRELIFRIHWDGDFFSEAYARAWARVIRENPEVIFWVYTRSFVPSANVAPILAGIPNLALYLSADVWNVELARTVAAAYPGVLLAYCTVDYKTGRQLARAVRGRKVQVCPENDGRLPLMGGDETVTNGGRGACVSCMLCPDARCDIIFSTSHKYDASAANHIRGQGALFPIDTVPITLGRKHTSDLADVI